MKVLRYLNARINAQVGLEDQQLSERVQIGHGEPRLRAGPLSDYEHAIKDSTIASATCARGHAAAAPARARCARAMRDAGG